MRVALVSVVVFLSGISALIFQTLWLRLSGLAFGNSIWAAALILSSFMGGLALGSAISASRVRFPFRPLRLYAMLELAVALFGCTLVFGLPLLGGWLHPVFQALWHHHGALNGLRFFLSLLILLVPTTAMGLTLPVLLDDPILRSNDFSRVIGILYGWNTLGAMVGAIVGEAWLVQAVGLYGTALAAGVANCSAAAIALLLTRIAGRAPASPPMPAQAAESGATPWRLLLVSLGAGGLFLCLEIVWFRFLRLYVASSSTAFSVMLAVVLAGIGLGGIAAGAIRRRAVRPNQVIPLLLIAAALATLLSYIFYPAPAVQESIGSSYIESWKQIVMLSVALMFPVALLSGILFPVIVGYVQMTVENRMSSTGLTTLFNTIGAAIGPLVASFLLLPTIGFQWSLLLCAAAYVALALLVSERSTWSLRRVPGAATVALGMAVVLVFAFFPYRRDAKHFAHARQPYELDGSYLIKKIEGNSDTLQLLRRDLFGESYYYRLVTNAYSMSSTVPRSQRYMRLFAYLPLTLRPESKDVLLICYGVGVTADAFVRDAHLQHIDIVDISKEVFDLAGFYSGPGYSNPLMDPRVTTFVQDGRFFLQASPRQYDVITGEPPPLKVAGTVNLYTEQFFSLMKDRLKAGGIATFWLPVYQLKVDEVKAILRAFHRVFPNASVWSSSDLEWIMTGINGPGRKLGEGEVKRLWNESATGTDLVRIGLEVPEQMAALFLMDGETIDAVTDETEPLSDIYPKRLTDARPDLEATYRFAYPYMEWSAAMRRFRSSPLIERIWPDALKSSLESLFLVRETRFRSQLGGSNWLAELDFYLRHSQLRSPVLEVLNSDEFRVAIARRLAGRSQIFPSDASADLVAGTLAGRDIAGAIRLLEREESHGFTDVNQLLLLVYLYCVNGNVTAAETLADANTKSIQHDWLVDWLWKDLQAEFGFRPPR